MPADQIEQGDDFKTEAKKCRTALEEWFNKLPTPPGEDGAAYNNKTANDNLKSALAGAAHDKNHVLRPLIDELRTTQHLDAKTAGHISTVARVVGDYLATFDPQAFALAYLEVASADILAKLADPNQEWRSDELLLYHKLPEPDTLMFGDEAEEPTAPRQAGEAPVGVTVRSAAGSSNGGRVKSTKKDNKEQAKQKEKDKEKGKEKDKEKNKEKDKNKRSDSSVSPCASKGTQRMGLQL